MIPLLSVEPNYALVVNNQSVEDIKFKYRIVPDASEVTSARIQIKNEQGEVLFDTPVPIVNEGEITWPYGQELTP